MNKATSILLTLSIMAFAAGAAGAGEVRVTYRFENPSVLTTEDGFSRIIFPNTIQAGKRGEPSFPFLKARILLPYGHSAARVNIDKRGWKRIDGNRRLYPKQSPTPLSLADAGEKRLVINSSAYQVNAMVHPPSSRFRTDYLRGHPIATGTFSPVGFNPAAGEAGYYSEVTVVVETVAGARGTAWEPKRDKSTMNRLSGVVDNPEDISIVAAAAGPEDYSYLIITRDSLEEAFAPLADFYNSRGFLTKVMTVEEIEPVFPGIDTAEKIRNAVITEYTDYGITHLLLGGDGDGDPGTGGIVPYRGFYCGVQSSSWIEDDNIPADLYYAALDGNWNADSDALWGEDGEEDFYSEIAVGRAPVETTADISIFINKTVMYQESPVLESVRTATLFGEHLYSDPLTYGGDEMDQLIDTCTAYGFSTDGIPPDFDILKVYDREASWTSSSVFAAFNMGTDWVAHAGHSNAGYVMKMYSSEVNTSNFANDGVSANFAITYSYGCYAGAFDYAQCVGEKMVAIETCSAAFFGNSRYGWFTEGTTNGPSHHFQREFYDAVFTEGITTLGAANQRSKDETVPFVDLPDEYEPGAHRWCFYALNLLGDPAMDGWTDTPSVFSPYHAESIGRSDTAFAVETYEPGTVGALYRDGVCYGNGSAGAEGRLTINISTAVPTSIDSLELTLTGHDRLPYRYTIPVETVTDSDDPVPALVLSQNIPNPFNPATTISFNLDREGFADLRVYDMSGREVDVLLSRSVTAGPHSVRWRPAGLASGVYMYVLRTEGGTMSRKAVLMR